MATKAEELELLKSCRGCLGKAAMDEPIFILRGQDKLAPALIMAWAYLAAEHGCDPDKVEAAKCLADRMEDWHLRKFPD